MLLCNLHDDAIRVLLTTSGPSNGKIVLVAAEDNADAIAAATAVASMCLQVGGGGDRSVCRPHPNPCFL